MEKDKNKKNHKHKKEINPDVRNAIAKNLKDKGYSVFCGANEISGIPLHFLVGTEFKSGMKNIKKDFSELVLSLGIPWYKSGEAYIEA
jgi:hypothetical protein